MKPFSAGYFIKQNRMRCCLLIFMFFLTYIAYIGGLYATNLISMNDYSMQQLEKYVMIRPSSEDENWLQFEEALSELREEGGITIIQQGVVSSLMVESIMQFTYGCNEYAFRTVEDFETYCDYMGITCDTDNLKKGSFIASQLVANNRGMKLGDELQENADEWVNQTYTLDAITDEMGYTAYFINDNENYNFMLLPTNMTLAEFYEYMDELQEKYDITVVDADSIRENDNAYLDSFKMIYAMIVVLLAIVMAVTINAAFVGMYQHRESEFAVYRAIGITKMRVVGKIIKELLFVDAIGIVIGGVVTLLGIYLLNHLVLIPDGFMLLYYHPIPFVGMILCNVVVLVPLVLTRSRQLLKADICEY